MDDNSQTNTVTDWWEETKGPLCPKCHKETFRFLPTPFGTVCAACFHVWTTNEDRKLQRRALINHFRRYGTLV